MRKSGQNVQKSNIGFLDKVEDRFQELGGKIKMTETCTKWSFIALGVKFNLETKTITAGLDQGDCDEG